MAYSATDFEKIGQAYKAGQITSSQISNISNTQSADNGSQSTSSPSSVDYASIGKAYKSGQLSSGDISSIGSQGGGASGLQSLLAVANGGSDLQSNLRTTQDKWDTTVNSYEAYRNNRNSPDFVYDENVNRNQYNSIRALMDDADADIALYRQQGNNNAADTVARDKSSLQKYLDELDAEYNANKPAETEQPQKEYIDTSIQKTLGSTADYDAQIADLTNRIAELERTNHKGVIGQDYNSQTGESYDVYGNVNDVALRGLRGQLADANANKAAAERAETRTAYTSNADFEQNATAVSPLSENLEAQKIISDDNRGAKDVVNSAKILLGYATDDENKMFNYIFNTQGKDAAREYLYDLRYDLNARQASEKSIEASKYADEHGVMASAKSVGQNLVSGAGLIDTAVQKAYRDITGNNRRIDYNTWANQQSQQVQAARGTVAQELAEKGSVNILGKDVSWGDVYQLGMSMADSGAAALIGGATGLGGGTAALLGASAGTSATQEAVKNGATDSQALALGFAAMAAETITEKVSLDNLLSAPGKSIVANALRQAGVEASEEAASTILNNVADEYIMKEDSEYNRRVREYEANGLSHEEAQHKAWNDFGSQLLFDAIGGAISGGIMGGIAKPVRNNIDSRTQQNTQTTQETTPQTTETQTAPTEVSAPEVLAERATNTQEQAPQVQMTTAEQEALKYETPTQFLKQGRAFINENIGNDASAYAQARQIWRDAQDKVSGEYQRRVAQQQADERAAERQALEDERASYQLTELEQESLKYSTPGEFKRALDQMRGAPFDTVASLLSNSPYSEATAAYNSAREKQRKLADVDARVAAFEAEPTETAETPVQNSPVEQTSASETNNVSPQTTPLATNGSQTSSAPTVSANTQKTAKVSTQPETQQTETNNPVSEAEAYRPVGQGEDVREHSTSQRIRERKTVVHDGLVAETEADPSFYKVRHNKDTIAKAEAVLFKTDGTEADLNDVVDHASNVLYDARENNKKIKPEDVLITVQAADRLIEHAEALEKQGLTEAAQAERARSDKLMKALYAEQAEAGQLSQASRLISRASPATQREMRQDYLNRCIKDWNSKLTKAQGRKMESKTGSSTISLPTELSEAYVNAKTDADLQKAYGDIVSYVGKNTPSNFYQQITALRFLNMLGNPVTQGRNIIGNSLNFVNYFVKRRMQTAIESMVTPGQKTFAMGYDLKDFGDWMQATSDPELAARLENNGRYQDVRNMNKSQFARDSADNQTIFKDKVWEGYRNITNKATTGGDIIFLKANFADAAAAYAKAHGFTFATATAEQKAAAIEVATKEAQEATFHDDTVVSDMVTRLHANENSEWAQRKRINYAATRVANALGDGLLPFRKTPANVLVRGEEFSPLGLLNTAVKAVARHNDIKKTGTSEITTSDIINQFSKSLTGTGLTILGAALRAAGKARTSDDEDKDLNNYEKLNGKQDYAIKIGKTWATADWGAPDSIPFFMGVELYDALHDNANFTEDDIINIIGSLTGTMTEMSMLQGINDTMKGLDSYGADDNALMKFVTALGTSYLQQMLGNSLFGRLESAATPYRQETYIDPDSKLSKERQYAISKLSNKIPFWDYQQADYIDPWGNKQLNQDTNNPLLRGVRAVGSPAYISEEKATKFDDWLTDLHDQLKDTDFKGDVLPQTISRSTIVGNERLTPEEYEIYATNVGQMRRQMAETFYNSDLRETLSPEEQGKIVKDIYEYCESRGKADILERRGEPQSTTDQWADEVEHFGDDTNALTRYLATKDIFKDSIESGDYEAIDALLETINSRPNSDGGFTSKETQYYADNIDGLEKYILASRAGVTSEMLTEAKNVYSDIDDNKDLSKEEMTNEFYSWLDNSHQTNKWTEPQKDAVRDLLKYWNMSPVNTERYEKMRDNGLDTKNISLIQSKLSDLDDTEGYDELTSSQQTYKKYDIILKEAAALPDDQALALVKSYGSLGPGGGKLKYMVQEYFGDKDEDFQIELYNSVRDERKWSHNWRWVKPENPYE